MKNQKGISTLIGIIIIAIAAAVFFGGIFVYQYLAAKTQTIVSVQQNPMTGWKTYTNNQYGFEFEYPSDWKLSEYPPYGIVALDKNRVPTDSEYNSVRDESEPGTLTFHLKNSEYAIKAVGKSINVNIGQNNSIQAAEIKDPGPISPDNPFWANRGLTTYIIRPGQPQNQILINYVYSVSDTQYDQTVSQILQSMKLNETAGWNTYNNFGIEFQYPQNWGMPQENISGLGQESISFDFNPSDYQPFSVYTQKDIDPQTGGIKNETFDQMVNRWLANNKNIYLVKNISAGGLSGKELFYNSAVTGKPYHLEADFPLSNGFYVSLSADLASAPQDVFEKIVSTLKIDGNTQVKTDPATGMLIYKNSEMTFEYPEKFNTDYASLTLQTIISNPGDSKIGSSGCYILNDPVPKESHVTINNTQFCLSTGGDVGAGQLYNDYYYTVLKNGKYYTIGYAVHTSNGCGVYKNADDINAPGNEKYKECLDFGKNYDSIVMKPIQDSIATLKFTN